MADLSLVDGRLKAIFSELFGVEAEKIDRNATPEKIDGWDSVRQLDLVTSIESAFGVEFTEQEIVSTLGFGLLRDAVVAKLQS